MATAASAVLGGIGDLEQKSGTVIVTAAFIVTGAGSGIGAG